MKFIDPLASKSLVYLPIFQMLYHANQPEPNGAVFSVRERQTSASELSTQVKQKQIIATTTTTTTTTTIIGQLYLISKHIFFHSLSIIKFPAPISPSLHVIDQFIVTCCCIAAPDMPIGTRRRFRI